MAWIDYGVRCKCGKIFNCVRSSLGHASTLCPECCEAEEQKKYLEFREQFLTNGVIDLEKIIKHLYHLPKISDYDTRY